MVASLLPAPLEGSQLLSALGRSWRCQLCNQATPPIVGSFIAAARHSCRACGRTVCEDCSTLPLSGAKRTCRACYLEDDEQAWGTVPPREKYVFLVRHAQSTWNANVDVMKGCSAWSWQSLGAASACVGYPLIKAAASAGSSAGYTSGSPFQVLGPEVTIKDVVARAAHLMTHDVWNRDHPISQEGHRQTDVLREKIGAWREQVNAAEADASSSRSKVASSAGSPVGAASPDQSSTARVRGRPPQHTAGGSRNNRSRQRDRHQERVRHYYDALLTPRRSNIYCSPHLRALQTAHLVLPEEEWGSITLLKDARERFRFKFERDCLGAGCGGSIVDRATLHLNGQEEISALQRRVDASDCEEKWWSEEPETEGDLEARLEALWRKLLDEDDEDSCVLVTHSNLIKALMMRYGCLGDGRSGADLIEGDATQSTDEARRLDVEGGDTPPFPSSDDEEEADEGAAWQVLHDGPEALRELKVRRLQNCGVLGLRCVQEVPPLGLDFEVDGWVDISACLRAAEGGADRRGNIRGRCGEPQWVAKDALLMFDSVLVQ